MTMPTVNARPWNDPGPRPLPADLLRSGRCDCLPLVEMARWLTSLDDVDGPGAQARRTVTLTQIINRARLALGEE
jgi:hypothetical protein